MATARDAVANNAAAEPPTLEGRLQQLRDLMAASAVLSEQVSADLEARAATAQKLQEEAVTQRP